MLGKGSTNANKQRKQTMKQTNPKTNKGLKLETK